MTSFGSPDLRARFDWGDGIIRNTHRVLMTRGMKGHFVS